jgi:hypothetical protein
MTMLENGDQHVAQQCGTPGEPVFKTVCLVRKDLDPGTVANVIGHCAVALGALRPQHIVTRPELPDADGAVHAGVSGWPFVVLTTRRSKLDAAVRKAKADRRIEVVAFLREMLTTHNDAELVEAVAAQSTESIEWFGVVAYGIVSAVDEHFASFALWNGG